MRGLCREAVCKVAETSGLEEAEQIPQHPRQLGSVQAIVPPGRGEVGARLGLQIHRPAALCDCGIGHR